MNKEHLYYWTYFYGNLYFRKLIPFDKCRDNIILQNQYENRKQQSAIHQTKRQSTIQTNRKKQHTEPLHVRSQIVYSSTI